MSINNSPVLNVNAGLSQFRFWCQKVLPLVYDDSLSYYETLCKIAGKLNEAITSANTSQENIVLLKQAYDELLEYINEYTKTLDATIAEKINESLNNMVQSGELFDYVISRITAADVGAAPAGYGLGETAGSYVPDIHAINKVGFYQFDSTTANKPKHFPHGVISANIANGVIYLTATYTELQARTFYGSEGWNEWEYVNPPLSLGVEYRTTEKWQYKPVYTKVINVGAFPSVGATSFYGIGNDITKIIRVNGTSSTTGFSVPYCSTDAYITISGTVYGGNASVILYAERGDIPSGNCIAQVWYIKE